MSEFDELKERIDKFLDKQEIDLKDKFFITKSLSDDYLKEVTNGEDEEDDLDDDDDEDFEDDDDDEEEDLEEDIEEAPEKKRSIKNIVKKPKLPSKKTKVPSKKNDEI